MANSSQVQVDGAQSDRAQEREAKPNPRGNWRWLGLTLMLGAVIAAVAAGAFIQFRSGETTAAVSHVGDHSQLLHMGHLLLTEWDVAGLNSVLSNEVKVGDSALEVHNDGQTVHRLSIWRGGAVEGDQLVGGTLVAETGYIRPGELTLLNVNLKPGKYVLVCSVRGHAARGVVVVLIHPRSSAVGITHTSAPRLDWGGRL